MTHCSLAITQDLASAVRDARHERGLSITEASELAGIDRVTWWRIETGRSRPGIDTAQAIADALGVQFGDLIHESEGTPVPTGRGKSNGVGTAAKRSADPVEHEGD
jgi:transcriptional regulator with XRE-family HTH domain